MPRADSRQLLARRRAFGRRMRGFREDAGLSQEALADLAGIHRTYVGSVERGERNVALDNINRIASALNISPARLVDD
jgi:transcriptional regulator with XRE-family HTH domain